MLKGAEAENGKALKVFGMSKHVIRTISLNKTSSSIKLTRKLHRLGDKLAKRLCPKRCPLLD